MSAFTSAFNFIESFPQRSRKDKKFDTLAGLQKALDDGGIEGDPGDTMLHFAVKHGNTEVVDELLMKLSIEEIDKENLNEQKAIDFADEETSALINLIRGQKLNPNSSPLDQAALMDYQERHFPGTTGGVEYSTKVIDGVTIYGSQGSSFSEPGSLMHPEYQQAQHQQVPDQQKDAEQKNDVTNPQVGGSSDAEKELEKEVTKSAGNSPTAKPESRNENKKGKDKISTWADAQKDNMDMLMDMRNNLQEKLWGKLDTQMLMGAKDQMQDAFSNMKDQFKEFFSDSGNYADNTQQQDTTNDASNVLSAGGDGGSMDLSASAQEKQTRLSADAAESMTADATNAVDVDKVADIATKLG